MGKAEMQVVAAAVVMILAVSFSALIGLWYGLGVGLVGTAAEHYFFARR